HSRAPRYFFVNVSASTCIYTLSLHDALPIYLHFARFRERRRERSAEGMQLFFPRHLFDRDGDVDWAATMRDTAVLEPHHLAAQRSEEHTSELQSRVDLVCRLLLEKKKTIEL